MPRGAICLLLLVSEEARHFGGCVSLPIRLVEDLAGLLQREAEGVGEKARGVLLSRLRVTRVFGHAGFLLVASESAASWSKGGLLADGTT